MDQAALQGVSMTPLRQRSSRTCRFGICRRTRNAPTSNTSPGSHATLAGRRWTWAPRRSASIRCSETAAREAIRLDPMNAHAHAALAALRFWYDWKVREAEATFKRAFDLNPRLGSARHDYGWLLIASRRFDRGVAEIRKAQALNPLSPRATIDVGWALLRAGRYAEAVAQSRRTLELEPIQEARVVWSSRSRSRSMGRPANPHHLGMDRIRRPAH